MKDFVTMIVALLLMVPNALVSGFLYMKLWEWFIVTEFSVAPLSFVGAIGISFFITFILKGKKDQDEAAVDLAGIFNRFGVHIVTCSLFLLFGWIIQLFI